MRDNACVGSWRMLYGILHAAAPVLPHADAAVSLTSSPLLSVNCGCSTARQDTAALLLLMPVKPGMAGSRTARGSCRPTTAHSWLLLEPSMTMPSGYKQAWLMPSASSCGPNPTCFATLTPVML